MNQLQASLFGCIIGVTLCVSSVVAGDAANAAEATMTVKFRDNTSFQQALDIAKAENKYLFVDAYTDWCGWCKVMDRETFTNDEVGQVMNNNFVSVKIEMESGFGIDLSMKYGVRSFPTFLVLASDGRLVQRLSGYMPPADFVPILHKALNPATQQPEPGYALGVSVQWPEFMRPAFGKAKERKMPDSSVVNTWLSGQKDWSTEVAWGVIATFRPKMANDYVVTNRKALKLKYGQNVSGHLDGIVYGSVNRAAKLQDEQMFSQAMVLLRQIREGDIASDSILYRVTYYHSGKIWGKLGTSLVDGAREGYLSVANINRYAWDMYENCDDKAALVQATEAMNIGLEKEKGGFEELDTYASLLYKTQCYPQAEQAAIKAIEAGKVKGADVTGTEDLLGKIRESEKSKTR